MISLAPLKYVSLASLFLLGSGCIIVQSRPYSAPVRHTTGRPKPAKKPAAKPQPKPQPKPAAKPQPKPQPKPAPKPAPTPRPAPTPKPAPQPEAQPGTTHMVVPVRVAFAEAVEKIDSMILKTVKQDWKVVSGPKDPTRVEVKYTIWRDPIQASFVDGKLNVTVSVRYAADVRASAKNPLGGGRIWITKGETWGTQAEPQRLTAKFHAAIAVQDDFSVQATAALDDIDHGKAPSGKVCVKALAKLCVTKETIAPMVHKNLEQQLVPQIEKALANADQQVEKALNLKPHAQTLWTALQQPQSLQALARQNCPPQLGTLCTTPAWLVARPESVAISGPRMDGKDLRVDLGFAGKFAVELGARPAVTPTPLPKLKTVTDPPGFAVRARLELPLATLNAELAKQLQGKEIDPRGTPGMVVTNIVLVNHADPRNPRRLHVVVSVSGGGINADVTLAGEVAWDPRSRELYLKDFDYMLDTNSKQLKALSEANYAVLRRRIAERARWKLDVGAATLGKAVTGALGNVWAGHLDVEGSLDKVAVEKFAVQKDVLAADVVIAGQLGVSFTP